jgi:hypothetical protein
MESFMGSCGNLNEVLRYDVNGDNTEGDGLRKPDIWQ